LVMAMDLSQDRQHGDDDDDTVIPVYRCQAALQNIYC
jgi:hypothetical protein